jgi:subtilisin family serine protease
VKRIERVARSTSAGTRAGARLQAVRSPLYLASPLAPVAAADSTFYGPSYPQLRMVNAVAPLERGIRGEGVRLGFLDTRFRGLQHPAFDALREDARLLGLRDFTEGGVQTNNHGGAVVSVAVGHAPGTLVGPAHRAEVLAATTEFTPSERNVEEDYFIAGLEWMEAQGADVVNVSLGYTRFDEGERSYTPDDLDGNTAVTTRAVDAAARLGLAVVVSAGNSGCDAPSNCWFYVSTPADADSSITVGGVKPNGSLASFSSRGPTADGRIKPDVAALGSDVVVAWGADRYVQSGGTSFASPLVAAVVAQMLQVNPSLTPMQVRALLRRTASQPDRPDNKRGWGIIDADAAIRSAEHEARRTPPSTLVARPPAPNPSRSEATFAVSVPSRLSTLDVSLYDVMGRRVVRRTETVRPGPNRITLDVSGLTPGVYLYRLEGAERLATGKLVVLR